MFLQSGQTISILQKIKLFDYKLFSKINGEWHNNFFDALFPFTRETFFWLPFYFFLILFAIINFKKHGVVWILFFAANAGVSDYVSSTLIKGNFSRLRPCRDPYIADQVRFLVKYCPVNSSFTSSHACNFFAAAMFIFITFKGVSKWRWFVFLWAAIPSYAQMYVGVHFPTDVLCGMILGLISGYFMATIFNKKAGLIPSNLSKAL